MSSNRLPFDEYLILLAHIASLRSEDPFSKMGCVSADKENKVLCASYNGLISKFDPPPDFYKERENPLRELMTVHSEINNLLLCPKNSIYTLAINCSPCFQCAKSIAAHGVKRVIYSTEYWRDPNSFKQIFDFYKVEYKQVTLRLDVLQNFLRDKIQ